MHTLTSPARRAPGATRAAGASIAAALLLGGIVIAQPASAADFDWATDAFRGQVQVVDGDDGTPEVLDGVVFEDTNRNSVRDEGEPGIAGVAVSNGREVVLTDAEGAYEIAVANNDTVTMSQPAGYQVPVDEANIPQFSYIHLPEGTPYPLEMGGLEPTGPLPDAVNFPLVASAAHAAPKQNLAIATDVQAVDSVQIGYAAKGPIAALAARTDYSSAGVLFTGDLVDDDLRAYPEFRERITGAVNGPAWVTPGNHDMDFDAADRAHAFDTFRSYFGATQYSFNVGDVHVIMMDDIDYPVGADYTALLSEDQLAWLAADLAVVPEDKTIVFATHIPLQTFTVASAIKHQVPQLHEVYSLLEGREVVTLAGHTHTLEYFREGDSLAEWKDTLGIDALPYNHIVAGSLAGAWYRGPLLPEGYPFAPQADGTPPGTVTLEFTGPDYVPSFVATGHGAEDQMHAALNTPAYRAWYDEFSGALGTATDFTLNTVAQDDLDETWLAVNFWMGGSGDVVTVSVDGGEPVVAERTQPMRGESVQRGAEFSDPHTARHQLINGGTLASGSTHLWRAALPTDLEVGQHTVEMSATDIYGRTFTHSVTIEVTESSGDDNGDGDNGGDGNDGNTGGDIPVTAVIPGTDGGSGEGDGTGDGDDQPTDGALALSIAEGGLNLGDARNAGDRLRLTGVLPQVSVTDSRSARQGWTVTGQARDLTAEQSAVVRAANLGWEPFVAEGPAQAGAIVAPELAGGPGLAAPATLGTGTEAGTAALSADVRLEVPVDTKAGTYSGGVTVSLFPQD